MKKMNQSGISQMALEGIELRHLRSFRAVADHLNFHRAAEALRMTQPALSRQIMQFEELLGRPLFLRDRKRVALSGAGKYLNGRAGELLEAFELLVRETREAADGKLGTLALGYTEAVMASFLPRILRELRGRQPGVAVSLRQGHSERLEREVALGRIDAALVSLPSESPGLACSLVEEELVGIVLPDNHPLAGKRTVELKSLSRETFVMFPHRDNPRFYADILAACREAGFAPRRVEEADSRILAVSMVAAGLGVAPLSEHLAHYCGQGAVFRHLSGPRPKISFYLIEPEGGPNKSVAGLKALLPGMSKARAKHEKDRKRSGG